MNALMPSAVVLVPRAWMRAETKGWTERLSPNKVPCALKLVKQPVPIISTMEDIKRKRDKMKVTKTKTPQKGRSRLFPRGKGAEEGDCLFKS